MEYKEGMKVRVIGDSCCHGYPIGKELVLLDAFGPQKWWVKKFDGGGGTYVEEKDIVPIFRVLTWSGAVPREIIGKTVKLSAEGIRKYGEKENQGGKNGIGKIVGSSTLESGWAQVDWRNGRKNGYTSGMLEEVEIAKDNSVEFKEGKKFKVIGDSCNHGIEIGTVITLGKKYDLGKWWIVEKPGIYIKEQDIEPTSEIDLKKFRAGMLVRIIGDSCHHGISRGTIIKLDKPYTYGIKDAWWVEGRGVYAREEDIEPVDSESKMREAIKVIESIKKNFAVVINNEEEWNAVQDKAIKDDPNRKISTEDGKIRWMKPEGTRVLYLYYPACGLGWDRIGDCRTEKITAEEYLGKKVVAKREEKKIEPLFFGVTPVVIEKIAKKEKPKDCFSSHQCPVCRCDTRIELHSASCTMRFHKAEKYEPSGLKEIKEISEKPSPRKFNRWFDNFTKKLMN